MTHPRRTSDKGRATDEDPVVQLSERPTEEPEHVASQGDTQVDVAQSAMSDPMGGESDLLEEPDIDPSTTIAADDTTTFRSWLAGNMVRKPWLYLGLLAGVGLLGRRLLSRSDRQAPLEPGTLIEIPPGSQVRAAVVDEGW